MWFATHWIFCIEYKDDEQESYPVLERVILLEAFDHDDARKKAAQKAQQEQLESTDSFQWGGGRKANLRFMGVSKVIVLSTDDGGSSVIFSEDQELTNWEYIESKYEDITNIVSGKRASVDYIT